MRTPLAKAEPCGAGFGCAAETRGRRRCVRDGEKCPGTCLARECHNVATENGSCPSCLAAVLTHIVGGKVVSEPFFKPEVLESIVAIEVLARIKSLPAEESRKRVLLDVVAAVDSLYREGKR